MNKKSHIVILALLGLLLSSSSYARSRGTGITISGMFGLDMTAINGVNFLLNGSSIGLTDASFGYGFRVGYTINPSFEFGLSLTACSITPLVLGTSLSAQGVDANETYITADFDYYLPDEYHNFYIGARAGIGITAVTNHSSNGTFPAYASQSGFTGAGSGASLAIGAVAGYDFHIDSRFKVGPRISYIATLPSSIQTGTVTDFQIHAMVGYSF